ncbi:MAG: hypothetical protein HYY40_10370 [Bacteroidetes bacterium]|nr:hypothetical protein [Bacteroidota bacterium]
MALNLKNRIIAFLEARNYTFKDLAGYLELDEDYLTRVLDENSLEIRTLESISKALRIPLFSFFHDPSRPPKKAEVPFYTMHLPEPTMEKIDRKRVIEDLEYEIKVLKDIVRDKEEQLSKYKSPDPEFKP